MEYGRRDFLKLASLAGLSLAGSKLKADSPNTDPTTTKSGKSQFNMCGYAAPAIEDVRIGFVGLGNRGPAAVKRMSLIEGAFVAGLCDIREEKAKAADRMLDKNIHNPKLYTESEDSWKEMCESKDIDLIYIATPWALHTPMAVYAMEQGKHVCVEVPAAKTLDECWQLVETSEKTRKHCIILENCCYDFFELLTLNLYRHGLLGEIVHGEGAYIHALLDGNFSKTKYYNMWRLRENTRKGNLYPTHGLGPISQAMNINRGDRLEYLVSVSSDDFQMNAKAKELAEKDSFYEEFARQTYRGNANTTTVRTALGKTIMIQHDVTSPNVYSRIHKLTGTKGTCLKYPFPEKIAFDHEGWVSEGRMKELKMEYNPPIVKRMGEIAGKIGGHGGMDFLMDWRTIDCLRNGLPMDMDVYDSALWSSIAPLSEYSVSKRSQSVDVPDFTRDNWKTNKPIDTSMSMGGNTNVRG